MSRTTNSAVAIASPVVYPTAVSVTIQPLALNLLDAAKIIGVSSWTLRESILLGNLRAKKAGRNHIILISELHRWLDGLDDVESSNAPSILQRKAARDERGR
jgi:hypothetical protein